MKVGIKRMWQLMLHEVDSISIKGKPLYIDEDEYGCDFIYDGKRLHFDYDNCEEMTNDASCQRLCDKVNEFFKFE